jgi:hypothetical protein
MFGAEKETSKLFHNFALFSSWLLFANQHVSSSVSAGTRDGMWSQQSWRFKTGPTGSICQQQTADPSGGAFQGISTCVQAAQTSHNLDCFLGSFFYIRTVFRLNCLTAQPSYEGRAAVERVQIGTISKFAHHYIKGGAVDNTWLHR